MIDSGLRTPWPPDIVEATDLFKQGHLVERPPFFYAASPSIELWGASDATGAEDAEGGAEETEIRDLPPEACPPYGIITSQTCDIRGPSASKYPWVQIAPVYRIEAERAESFAQRQYAIGLTAPPFAGEHWYADLRVEFPLEKGTLAGRHPLEAFADEAGYLEFARLLGRRRERAALADSLVQVVAEGITAKRQDEKGAERTKEVWASLQHGGLRLSVVEGDRLDPKQARLHVVTDGPPSEGVRNWFDEWFDVARLRANELEFALLATEFLDGTCVNAEHYRSLIDLGILKD